MPERTLGFLEQRSEGVANEARRLFRRIGDHDIVWQYLINDKREII